MACSSLPANLLSSHQKVIDKLVQGREVANQLQTILSLSHGDDDESVVTLEKELVSRIMESFSNILFMLNKNATGEAVVSMIQATTSSGVDSPACLDARKSEGSEESFRNSTVSTNLKDRRGCYKRRKTGASTWERETSTLTDDGRAWRKYGQKMIHNAKHPRSYYRCTHKSDQGCQATKQVQQIEDNPPMYKTTYYGHHTCRDLQTAPELVMNCTSPGRDSSPSFLISFNNANLNLTSEQPHLFLPSVASTKEKYFKDIEKVVPCNNFNDMIVAHNMNQASSSDYMVSPNCHQYHLHDHHHEQDDDLEYLMRAFDQPPWHVTVLSSNLDYDHIHGDGDVWDDVL